MLSNLKRCPTGIPGFDEVTEGGFIRGSLTLIAGPTGSGKSTFAAKFIYEGAHTWNEKGMYVSFNEPKTTFFNFMKTFNMNFEELEEKGLITFIEMPIFTDVNTYMEFLKVLYEKIRQLGIKRLVIDPISPISPLMKVEKLRAHLRNTLLNLCNLLNVTTLLIVEVPKGARNIGATVEEFVADAVILFKLKPYRRGRASRWVSIIKMRGLPIVTTNYELILTEKGPIIVIPPKLESITVEYTKKIPLGIKHLDKALKGGIRKGTITVISGDSGSGKTLMMLNIAAHNAKHGKKVLYVSLEEPITQLKLAIKLLGLNYDELKRNLVMKSLSIETHSLGSLYIMFKDLIEKYNIDVIILDSLTTFSRYFDLRELREFMKYLSVLNRFKGVSFFTSLLSSEVKHYRTMVSTIADNYIILFSKVVNGRLLRFIRLKKLRAEVTPKDTFIIDLKPGKGLEARVYEPK